MPRIKPLREEDLGENIKEVWREMKKQSGMVPNLFATIAHYPKVLKPILNLYQALSKESTLEPKLQELANLEVSRINRCNYCLTHHTRMAKMQGLRGEQIEALGAGELEREFSDKEKAIIEYARQVTLDAENVPEELFNRIKSHFSPREIVNLTLIIGLMNVFNRFNGALGVELER